MTWTALIEVPFANELHRFRLGLGQLEDLESRFKVGTIGWVEKFRANEWRIGEMRAVFITALVGGGQDPAQAKEVVDRCMMAWPLVRNVDLFWKIVNAAILEPPPGMSSGKDQADEEEEMASTSPASSVLEEPSATPRRKSGA